ncbi:MAG: helix-turn-helix domain-containing protein [Gaiella sp.]
MPDIVLDLRHRTLGPALGELVRDARTLIGWTQRELAARALTSQAAIWRLETNQPGRVDLVVVERVLDALGMRGALAMDARHLADRRRQRDGVHARLTGYVARRLERGGWLTATEVPIGDGAPRGWIDLLAYRPADRALLIEETKTDIPDFGGLQRSVAFYDREGWASARRLGWRPACAAVLVVALDSAAMADRLAANRDLVTRAFPGSIDGLRAWLRTVEAPPPRGWSIALADPASRGARWLRAADAGRRRHSPPYAGYTDAARRLRLR